MVALLIDADGKPVRFGETIDDWQAEDFAALAPAWRRLAGHDVQLTRLRAWLERPHGHSKTTDIAGKRRAGRLMCVRCD